MGYESFSIAPITAIIRENFLITVILFLSLSPFRSLFYLTLSRLSFSFFVFLSLDLSHSLSLPLTS